ncbi:crossover junction endodeoxyribonuclease RuvC [Natronospira bacteriovora]|uniref:Crossover junction endodeoxyribonuclease RuvC n=1 Tax=Natronospira bacteriovora TaxID=3069753 RepID=A0ABU0W3C6_9GAMM|nr:crossover junction endodeoxyribonuclease RuvC [Natronospira sp. AB-CW4]MDQ2068514.1 crossover junction endodeoxyribonuclease RuvC [Natronospira sp. AB-CW4]
MAAGGEPCRILGIDPGSVNTGYAVIEALGSRLRHLESGRIAAGNGAFTDRLRLIFDGISDVVDRLAPAEVAVERVFVAQNADSAIKLGQARGAAICGALRSALPVSEYSPTEIKQAVVGSGRAAKEQVQHMVGLLLSLRETLQADQADALAVAICHAHTRASPIAMAQRTVVTRSRRGRRA